MMDARLARVQDAPEQPALAGRQTGDAGSLRPPLASLAVGSAAGGDARMMCMADRLERGLLLAAVRSLAGCRGTGGLTSSDAFARLAGCFPLSVDVRNTTLRHQVLPMTAWGSRNDVCEGIPEAGDSLASPWLRAPPTPLWCASSKELGSSLGACDCRSV